MTSRGRLQIALLAGSALLSPAAVIAQASAQPERPISLSEAVALALETNEEIRIERTSLASAESGVTGARGAYDPILSLRTDWGRTSTPVNSTFSGTGTGALAPTQESARTSATLSQLLATGAELSVSASAVRTDTDSSFDPLSPAWSSQLGIEFRQPLLRDRSIDGARAALRVAAADRRMASAGFHQTVIETVSAVEAAYWSLTAARSEIDVREESVRLADEQLAETLLRIEGGASPETEEAQPRAELERRRGELFAAREAVHRAESALRLLIVADGDDDMWAARLLPTDGIEIERAPIDVADAMDRALASRVELEAAQSLIERRTVERELAENEIPNLDLVVSYDRFGLTGSRNPGLQGFSGPPPDVPPALVGNLADSFGAIVDGDFEDARIGLVFDLAIGGRAARADKEIAAQARLAAEAALERARKAIRAEVLDAAAALETAGARIDAARAGREAAEVQLTAERERYAVGLSTNFLVLTRQNDLAEARLVEIGALTDYRIADTALRRATGSLLGDRDIEIHPGD